MYQGSYRDVTPTETYYSQATQILLSVAILMANHQGRYALRISQKAKILYTRTKPRKLCLVLQQTT